MKRSPQKFLFLSLVLCCGAAAAALAWPAPSAAPAAPPAPKAITRPTAAPAPMASPRPAEPPEPPEPLEPPNAFTEVDGDGDGVVVLSGRSTWLGVQIDDVTESRAAELKLRDAYGALVTRVEEASPAGRAGVRENDVIVSFQGQRVESTSSLRRFVREAPAGRTVAVGILRDGSERTLSVKLEARPARSFKLGALPQMNFKEFSMPRAFWTGGGPRLGVGVSDLSSQLGEYFGVKSGDGVLVTEVFDGTPAEKAGLKAGDVIVRIDQDRISGTGDIRDALRDKAGKDVEVVIVRDRREMTIKATLEEESEGDSRSFLPGSIRRQVLDETRRAMLEARAASLEAEAARRDERIRAREVRRDVLRSQRDAARELLRSLRTSGDLMAI
ncbi:MAG: PDZ domain-containing protein [Acidobacteria bacterium]|nr:PDZ domain-containing protein [Acidobacteriota bacterium]